MVSQPSAPDPYATAAAQNQQNQQASQYNSVASNANEVNPYGTVSYQALEQTPIYGANGQVSGYAPRYQRTTSLSPDQQKLFGLETQSKYNMGTAGVEQSAKLREHLKGGIDPSQWTPWQTGVKTQDIRQDTGATDRASIEKAMMESYDRSQGSANKAQEAQMAARGLAPGQAGYGKYQQGVLDARGEAVRQAYVGSGEESRKAQASYNDASTGRFNMDKALAEYYNNVRGGQQQEAIATRNQPINEITALMSGGQATIPQFQPFQSSQVASPNIGQYISDNYKNQSAAAATTNAGIFNLLGNASRFVPIPKLG